MIYDFYDSHNHELQRSLQVFLTYDLNICIKSQPFIIYQQVEEFVSLLHHVYVTGIHL